MRYAKFQGRIEDARFVTGRGAYVDDLTLDGLVHGALARAPMPGEIISVDVSAARAVPGVLGVWSAADLGLDAAQSEPRLTLRDLFVPVSDRECEIIEGEDAADSGRLLALKLREDKII